MRDDQGSGREQSETLDLRKRPHEPLPPAHGGPRKCLPEARICTEPSSIPPALRLPARPHPGAGWGPLPARPHPGAGVLSLQPSRQRKLPGHSPKMPPHHNSAKNRGKIEPIILILKGWEMALLFDMKCA